MGFESLQISEPLKKGSEFLCELRAFFPMPRFSRMRTANA